MKYERVKRAKCKWKEINILIYLAFWLKYMILVLNILAFIQQANK